MPGKPGVPVKLVWTREDDMKGGYYRPAYVHALTAGLDAQGNVIGWQHRIVGQSIVAGTPFEAMMVKDGIDATTVEGASTLPYAIPNLRVELHSPKVGVPVLWWRSVGSTHTAYSTETFIDELAAAAGKDPVAFRRALLAKHPRHIAALDLAAAKAGWGKPLAPGKAGEKRGRGVAVHESFGTVVAQVAEVTVRGKELRVDRVVCAVDCGIAVNPDNVRAQMEGGIGFGLSAALHGAITLTDGAVEQSNFHDYPVLRINEMPKVEVHIVPSARQADGRRRARRPAGRAGGRQRDRGRHRPAAAQAAVRAGLTAAPIAATPRAATACTPPPASFPATRCPPCCRPRRSRSPGTATSCWSPAARAPAPGRLRRRGCRRWRRWRPPASTAPAHYLGALGGNPCVALRVAAGTPAPAGWRFAGLRSLFFALPEPSSRSPRALPDRRVGPHASLLRRAAGRATRDKAGERAKECPACGLVAYPRVSPAMMVLVTRGRELLLARAHRFPPGMYSALAGFVEPGETIEDCIRREVREEVGVEVDEPVYFASQSWAFPHSLMIAYTAEYAGGADHARGRGDRRRALVRARRAAQAAAPRVDRAPADRRDGRPARALTGRGRPGAPARIRGSACVRSAPIAPPRPRCRASTPLPPPSWS